MGVRKRRKPLATQICVSQDLAVGPRFLVFSLAQSVISFLSPFIVLALPQSVVAALSQSIYPSFCSVSVL